MQKRTWLREGVRGALKGSYWLQYKFDRCNEGSRDYQGRYDVSELAGADTN